MRLATGDPGKSDSHRIRVLLWVAYRNSPSYAWSASLALLFVNERERVMKYQIKCPLRLASIVLNSGVTLLRREICNHGPNTRWKG